MPERSGHKVPSSHASQFIIKLAETLNFMRHEDSDVPPSSHCLIMTAQVPKKTRLYVEQSQREREQAADMHRIFQRDLAKLRLTTARAYVKVLTDGQVRCHNSRVQS